MKGITNTVLIFLLLTGCGSPGKEIYIDPTAADLVYEILTANLDFVDSGGFQFWDSLTAAIFTDHNIATFEDLELTVAAVEGPESGRTIPTSNGAKVKVVTSADRERFEQTLLKILNWNNDLNAKQEIQWQVSLDVRS